MSEALTYDEALKRVHMLAEDCSQRSIQPHLNALGLYGIPAAELGVGDDSGMPRTRCEGKRSRLFGGCSLTSRSSAR